MGRILTLALLPLALVLGGCSDSGSNSGDPEPASEEAAAPAPKSRPKVVQALPPGAEAPSGPPETPDVAEPEVLPENEEKPARVAATDADLLDELDEFARTAAHRGSVSVLQADGTASPPIEAPTAVQEVVHAGNLISKTPYKWGGGHGRWLDDGYDCSGSVSFALFAGGLLGSPLTSGGFMSWGEPGPGKWITIYTNPGHVFMVVAGLRFDTSGRERSGSRWQPEMRSAGGYTVRHPPGL